MSNSRHLLESIQHNLNESDNDLLDAVRYILDKNAIPTKKSISARYDNIEIWITDAGSQVKLDTKKDKRVMIHTQQGDICGPSIHLKTDSFDGYFSAVKDLKNQFDEFVNTKIEEKFIVSIDDKYLGNDGTLVDRNEAKVYNNRDNAEHDLYFYKDNNNCDGSIIIL